MVFRRRDQPGLLTRLRETVLPRGGWRRGLQYLGHRVRRLPDTPHRIALGFAAGVFASFTPLFGLHFVVAALCARAVRGNVVASLIGTLVGNPASFPAIAATSLWLGRQILGHGATGHDFTRVSDAFEQAAAGVWHSSLALVGLGHSEWSRLLPFLRDVFWPYLVGGLGPGLVAAAVAYYLTRPLIAAYQLRRRGRMIERAHHRLRADSEADAGTGADYNRHDARNGSEE